MEFMSAEYLFDSIGYSRDLSNKFNFLDMDNTIKYEKKEGLVTKSVVFDFKTKKYTTMQSNLNVHGHRMFIELRLHHAISKQIEELGWTYERKNI